MSSTSSSNSQPEPLEGFVIDIWQKALGISDIAPEDDFFDIGGQSFKAVRIANELGISVVDLFNNPTPRATARVVLQALQTKKVDKQGHTWLLELKRAAGTPSASIVCVPYGGAGPAVYRDLAHALPADVDVWAVWLPGHDPLDVKQTVDFDRAVAECVAKVREQVRGPISIYGHCAGNALALEIARQLEAGGTRLVSVHLGAMLPNKNPADVIARAHTSTVEDEVTFLKSIGGLEGALADDDLKDLIAVFKTDSLACANFFLRESQSAGAKLQAPLHIIVGDADPITRDFGTGYLGWQRFAPDVTLAVVAGGGHYFVKYQAGVVASYVNGFLQSRRTLAHARAAGNLLIAEQQS